MCCASCGALNPLPAETINYFELFGLERGYDLDVRALHRKYLSLSRSVHPDVAGPPSVGLRERSLSLSAELNRAYETLRDPVRRSEYLLALAGGPSAADDKFVPGELLAEVLVLREEIEEARSVKDTTVLQAIRQQVEARRQTTLEAIARLCRSLDHGGRQVHQGLRERLNTIKYWSNLLEQIPG